MLARLQFQARLQEMEHLDDNFCIPPIVTYTKRSRKFLWYQQRRHDCQLNSGNVQRNDDQHEELQKRFQSHSLLHSASNCSVKVETFFYCRSMDGIFHVLPFSTSRFSVLDCRSLGILIEWENLLQHLTSHRSGI